MAKPWTRIGMRIGAGLVGAVALLLGGYTVLAWAPDRPVSALRARWAPPPSVFIDVLGMSVHLRDEGPRDDPRPIVLLHGTSSSLHTWDGWAGALSPRRRVIRFDLPGFGLTGPTPDNVYSTGRYVQFVAALLERLGVRRCELVGNSFGGRLAWDVAVSRPELVERLVLIDAGGYPRQAISVPIGFRVAQLPFLARLMEVTLPRAVIASSLRNVYGDPTKVTAELVDRYYELTLRAGNRRALGERFKQAPSANDFERIAQVKAPTLILWGGRDRLIPPESAERFHHDIAGSRVVVLDDLGHTPHEEDPARTLEAAARFLDAAPGAMD